MKVTPVYEVVPDKLKVEFANGFEEIMKVEKAEFTGFGTDNWEVTAGSNYARNTKDQMFFAEIKVENYDNEAGKIFDVKVTEKNNQVVLQIAACYGCEVTGLVDALRFIADKFTEGQNYYET